MTAPHEINRPPSLQGLRSWLAVTRMWWRFPGAKLPMLASSAVLLGAFLLIANPYVDEFRFDTRGQKATAQVIWVGRPSPTRETAHVRYQPKGYATFVEANLTSGWRDFTPGEGLRIEYDPADLQRVRVSGDRVGLVAETAGVIATLMVLIGVLRRHASRQTGPDVTVRPSQP